MSWYQRVRWMRAVYQLDQYCNQKAVWRLWEFLPGNATRITYRNTEDWDQSLISFLGLIIWRKSQETVKEFSWLDYWENTFCFQWSRFCENWCLVAPRLVWSCACTTNHKANNNGWLLPLLHPVNKVLFPWGHFLPGTFSSGLLSSHTFLTTKTWRRRITVSMLLSITSTHSSLLKNALQSSHIRIYHYILPAFTSFHSHVLYRVAGPATFIHVLKFLFPKFIVTLQWLYFGWFLTPMMIMLHDTSFSPHQPLCLWYPSFSCHTVLEIAIPVPASIHDLNLKHFISW